MLKYILSAVLAIALAACGGDETPGEFGDQPEQPMGEEMPEQQAPMGEGADADVSDEELQAFFDAAMIAQEIQAGYQQQMEGILEDEDIELETYSQIYQSLQMGQDPDEAGISSEDMDKFEVADEKIDELSQELEEEINEAIAAEGLEMDIDRFQEIDMAIQQNPELQQRLQEMMMQEEGMPQPEPQPEGQQQPQPEEF